LPRKILLADDSVTAQNMGRKILTEAGYEVITVNNGAAAMKKISETKPDLVVLDVHMPGYGGLEICQRLRETPKLARIPVLLTVGKLEPFRSDDARRVNADAYVIKPFEASELLAVLTRLEDKIVPAMPDFGDSEGDWRSRLRIPAPYMKRDESPVEPSRETAPVEPVAPRAQETAPQAEAAQTEKVVSIGSAPAADSVPQEVAGEERFAAPASIVSQSAEEHVAPPELVETRPEPTAQKPFSVETESPSASLASALEGPADSSVASASAPETTTANQVAGALASLAPPAPGSAVEGSLDEQQTDDAREYATAALAAAGGTQTFAGPRWIADEVPVAEEESALVLELEMQRAYAAFAAADAARLANYRTTSSGPSCAESQAQATEEPREAGYDAQVAATVAAYIDSEEDLIYSEIAAAAANKTEDAVQPVSDAASAVAEPELEEKAAYAVAAAGAAAVSSGPASVEPAAEIPEVPPLPAEPVSQQEAELATAWEHWKQVRESVVSPEFTAQIAESAAGVVQESHSEPPLEPTPPEVSADAADEANEIASIVDSVLADLKPKLMEEISKKMGKGKKK
jgi:CheY-like chemotaxis protein